MEAVERRHRAGIAARVYLTLLMSLPVAPMFAQSAQQQIYVVSIGTASDTLVSGTLWLYTYSWGGIDQYKLATIQNGLSVVSLDIDRLKREVEPSPTEKYVVVVQAGEHLWFRTPDIAFDKFRADLPGAIRLLGASRDLPTGETQLILPAPVKRHLIVLYPDGRPRTNFDLYVSIYVSDHNQCGFHEGLPLGEFRTDTRGSIEVVAPLVPLYLDGLEYYEPDGTGPAGPAYSRDLGLELPADETAVVKVALEKPKFAVEVRVLTPTGGPRSGVDVYGNWRTSMCGGFDRLSRAPTDGTGTVRLNLDATFDAVTFRIGGPTAPEIPRETKTHAS